MFLEGAADRLRLFRRARRLVVAVKRTRTAGAGEPDPPEVSLTIRLTIRLTSVVPWLVTAGVAALPVTAALLVR